MSKIKSTGILFYYVQSVPGSLFLHFLTIKKKNHIPGSESHIEIDIVKDKIIPDFFTDISSLLQ